MSHFYISCKYIILDACFRVVVLVFKVCLNAWAVYIFIFKGFVCRNKETHGVVLMYTAWINLASPEN